jgi:hypothetical protein
MSLSVKILYVLVRSIGETVMQSAMGEVGIGISLQFLQLIVLFAQFLKPEDESPRILLEVFQLGLILCSELHSIVVHCRGRHLILCHANSHLKLLLLWGHHLLCLLMKLATRQNMLDVLRKRLLTLCMGT